MSSKNHFVTPTIYRQNLQNINILGTIKKKISDMSVWSSGLVRILNKSVALGSTPIRTFCFIFLFDWGALSN